MDDFWNERRDREFTFINQSYQRYDGFDALLEAIGAGDGPVKKTIIDVSAFRWRFEAEGKTGWAAIKALARRLADWLKGNP
ncbi:hypothetical protein ACFYN0_26570 [Streptomyces sp. NPDC006704]|uniref:hypothetical protein n=1 Tax=Streptomyces sp. NPDC006704 TaxID=3364760 RepID=UPI0036ADEE7C